MHGKDDDYDGDDDVDGYDDDDDDDDDDMEKTLIRKLHLMHLAILRDAIFLQIDFYLLQLNTISLLLL